MTEPKIEIYQTTDRQIEVKLDTSEDTVWLSQKQISTLFDKDVRTINEHVLNVYKQKELTKTATIRKFRIVQTEGNRKVRRSVDHYNLDMIISLGYRVHSARGVQFRQWATDKLKEYLIQGDSVNKHRFGGLNLTGGRVRPEAKRNLDSVDYEYAGRGLLIGIY